jgi:hypothetical protein
MAVITDSRTMADSTGLAIFLKTIPRIEERHLQVAVSLLSAAPSAALSALLTDPLLAIEIAGRRGGVAKTSVPIATDLTTVSPALLLTMIVQVRGTEIGMTVLPSDPETDMLTSKTEGGLPSYRVVRQGTLPWLPQDPRSLSIPTGLHWSRVTSTAVLSIVPGDSNGTIDSLDPLAPNLQGDLMIVAKENQVVVPTTVLIPALILAPILALTLALTLVLTFDLTFALTLVLKVVWIIGLITVLRIVVTNDPRWMNARCLQTLEISAVAVAMNPIHLLDHAGIGLPALLHQTIHIIRLIDLVTCLCRIRHPPVLQIQITVDWIKIQKPLSVNKILIMGVPTQHQKYLQAREETLAVVGGLEAPHRPISILGRSSLTSKAPYPPRL